MPNAKLHSSLPHFLMAALLALVPVLNSRFPESFFPGLPAWWVSAFSVLAGSYAAYLGFKRWWAILERRSRAKALVKKAAQERRAASHADSNDITLAGRTLSRLVRNVDEDLKEISPDFTPDSLKRLGKLLPLVLEEVEDEEGARIRLGVVGTYLGETLCRNSGWKWDFRADLSLRQFSYLASLLRKDGREFDPYAAAADLLTGQRKLKDLIKGAG